MPTLKRIARLRQVRVAHHPVHGPDTESNSRGRWITKNTETLMNLHFWSTDKMSTPKTFAQPYVFCANNNWKKNDYFQKKIVLTKL